MSDHQIILTGVCIFVVIAALYVLGFLCAGIFMQATRKRMDERFDAASEQMGLGVRSKPRGPL